MTPPPVQAPPALEEQAITNLVDLYRTALVQEDIDRLQALLAPQGAAVPAATGRQNNGELMDAESFREDMSREFQDLAFTAVETSGVNIEAESQRVTFTEVESVEDPATLSQRTWVFHTTFQLRQETLDKIQTVRIVAVRRQGPLAKVTTQGQVLAHTPTRLQVQSLQLDIVSATVTVPETGAVSTLTADGDSFNGLFIPPRQGPAQPLQIRLQERDGSTIELTHPYRLRRQGDRVVGRIAGTADTRFFAVTVDPTTGTVWAGGDRGARLYQIAAGGNSTAVEIGQFVRTNREVAEGADEARVNDLAFDDLGRLHVLAFAAAVRGGDFILKSTALTDPAVIAPAAACQTVNVEDDSYPFQVQNTMTGMSAPSASTRLLPIAGGEIWLFGSEGGVARVVDGFRDGVCPEGRVPVTYTSQFIRPDPTPQLLTNVVPALVVAGDGTMWFGTALGLVRLRDGELDPVLFDPDIIVEGNISTLESFFQAVAQAIFEAQPLTTVRLGDQSLLDIFNRPLVKEDLIFSAVEDLQGRLWVGTLGGGIRRISMSGDNTQELHLTRQDGLSSNIIFALAVAPDGSIWAATDEGVSHLQEVDGEVSITSFSALDGLPTLDGRVAPVRDVAVDASGTVWLSTDGGMFRLVPGTGVELRAMLENDRPVVDTEMTLEVAVRDAAGALLPNTRVTFTIIEGQGALSARTVSTDSDGRATTSLTLARATGSNRVEVRSAGSVPMVFTATGEADRRRPRLIRVLGNNQTVDPGRPLPLPFVMRMEDQFGNRVEDEAIRLNIRQGSASLVPVPVPGSGAPSVCAEATFDNQAEATMMTDTQGKVAFCLRAADDSETDIVVEGTAAAEDLMDVEPVQFFTIVGMVDIADQPRDIAVSGDVVYIAARFDGLQVIDASDPANPVQAPAVALDGTVATVAVEGDLAYVATSAPTVFYVFDISNPLEPVEVSCLRPPPLDGEPARCAVSGFLGNSLEPVKMVPRGSLAYSVFENRSADNGVLLIFDVMDRLHPTVVGSEGLPVHPEGLTVEAGFAYIPLGGNCLNVLPRVGCLHVIDVRDPRNPQPFGPGLELLIFAGIVSVDDRAYVVGCPDLGEHPDANDCLDNLRFIVIDLSTPGMPVQRGSTPLRANGLPFTASTVAVSGDFAYVASFDLGLQAFDIRNPEAPRFVGRVDIPSVAFNVATATSEQETRLYVTDLAVGLNIIAGIPLRVAAAEDSDNDGVIDFFDACPTDASETLDSDNDGVCNNADSDDDNDGFSDTEEVNEGTDPLNFRNFPLTPAVPEDVTTLVVNAAACTRRGNGSDPAAYCSITDGLRAVRVLRAAQEVSETITLMIQPGTYSPFTTLETFPLSIRHDRVIVQGAGATNTQIDAASFANGLEILGDRITIAGLQMLNGINGIVINDFSGRGITLRDNEVVNNLFTGISAGVIGLVTLENNIVADNGLGGIEVFSPIDSGFMGRAILTHNRVQRNGADGIFIFGANVEIDRNIVTDNAGDGIQIEMVRNDDPDNNAMATLASNTIQRNEGFGILAVDVEKITIRDHRAPSGAPIAANGLSGVAVQNNSEAMITNNDILNNGRDTGFHGIQLASGSFATITDNAITANGNGETPGAGIVVSEATKRSTITANRLQGNGTGISVLGSMPGAVCADIDRNTIRDSLLDGILLFATDDCRLTDNTSTRNGLSGLVLLSESFAEVNGGAFTNNAEDGISLFEASRVDIGRQGGIVTLGQNGGWGIFVSNDDSQACIDFTRVVFETNGAGEMIGNVIDLAQCE